MRKKQRNFSPRLLHLCNVVCIIHTSGRHLVLCLCQIWACNLARLCFLYEHDRTLHSISRRSQLAQPPHQSTFLCSGVGLQKQGRNLPNVKLINKRYQEATTRKDTWWDAVHSKQAKIIVKLGMKGGAYEHLGLSRPKQLMGIILPAVPFSEKARRNSSGVESLPNPKSSTEDASL